jgi:hypothetical protein
MTDTPYGLRAEERLRHLLNARKDARVAATVSWAMDAAQRYSKRVLAKPPEQWAQFRAESDLRDELAVIISLFSGERTEEVRKLYAEVARLRSLVVEPMPMGSVKKP